jgi:hypothetical protein
MKATSPKAPTLGTPINLDSMLDVQAKGSQQPLEVQSNTMLEHSRISTKNIYNIENIYCIELAFDAHNMEHLQPFDA